MAMTIRPAAPLDAELALPMALVVAQLRLEDDGAQNALLDATRLAALMWVEKRVGRSLHLRAWVASFDEVSSGLHLPMGPVAAITTLTYRWAEDVPVIWPAASYRLVGDDLQTATGLSWRAAFAGMSITVEYTAGYADLQTEAPQLQMAALLLLMHLWTGGSLDDVPATVAMLCEPDRVPVIG